MRIEIGRIAVEDEDVTPYFWAAGGDFETFEATLDDPTVADSITVEDHDDERLYQVTWERNAEGIIYAVSETGVTILEATSEDGSRFVEMLFPDSESLSEFQDYSAAHDLSFELIWLHRSTPPGGVRSVRRDREREQERGSGSHSSGTTFWWPRNRFSGSFSRFTSARRS